MVIAGAARTAGRPLWIVSDEPPSPSVWNPPSPPTTAMRAARRSPALLVDRGDKTAFTCGVHLRGFRGRTASRPFSPSPTLAIKATAYRD